MTSPPLVVPNAALVTLYWTNAGQLTENVLGARHAAGMLFNQALAEALGSAIKTAFTTNLQTLMPSNTSLVRVAVRDIASANQPEFRDTGAIVSGNAASDSLPPQTALCITFRTARSGRSYRGRTFLSGFSEAQSDVNGRAAATASTGAINFINAVRSAMTTSGLTHGVVSRPSYQVIVTEVTTFNDGSTKTRILSRQLAKAGQINDVTIIESRDARWETQRRRTNSRGSLPTTLDPIARIVY